MKRYDKKLTESNAMAIANEIRRQIFAQDKWAFGSWGARGFAAGDGKMGLIGFQHKMDGYLQFDVKGLKFKGRVIVALMPDDTYTVLFYKIRGTDVKLEHWVDNVYFDSLVEVIDGYVENTKADRDAKVQAYRNARR